MLKKISLYLKNFDWILLASVILLASFGLVEIYSIALGQETEGLAIFKKQLMFVLGGIAIVFIVSFLDYQLFKDYAYYLYFLGLILLLLVLFFGSAHHGATRWLDVKLFSFQPIEITKVFLVILLAKFFSSRKIEGDSWQQLLWSGILVFIPFLLVVLQPDFGSAMLFFIIWITIAITAGFNKKYFLVVFFIGVLAVGGMWEFYFRDYQKDRILTFINPAEQSLEQRHNVDQAIIAVGAGGLTGRGVGFGSQSQLKFLPEVENDFIFAVIAEELGFIGVSLLLLFFGLFFYRCLNNLKKINNDFGIFLILGTVGLIFAQMFINIGMNMGILPVVGIPLPFISYGGTALLSMFLLVGIIQNIIIKSKINY